MQNQESYNDLNLSDDFFMRHWEDTTFKDCRIVWNTKLISILKNRFYQLIARLGNNYKLGSLYTNMVVDLKDIGKATAYMLIFQIRPLLAIGEVVSTIEFQKCNNIEDVLDAFTTKKTLDVLICRSYIDFYEEPYLEINSVHQVTDLLLPSLKKFIHNPQKEDLLFNITPPKGIKDRTIMIYQRSYDKNDRIMLEVTNRGHVEIFDQKKYEKGLCNQFLNFFSIFKNLKGNNKNDGDNKNDDKMKAD